MALIPYSQVLENINEGGFEVVKLISGANIERPFNIKRVFYLFIENREKRRQETGNRRQEIGDKRQG
jgi:hypothetical protein